MTIYNWTQITGDISNYFDLFYVTNKYILGEMYGLLILCMFALLFLIMAYLATANLNKSIGFAGFGVGVVSVIFGMLKFVPEVVMYVCVVVAAVSLLFLFKRD